MWGRGSNGQFLIVKQYSLLSIYIHLPFQNLRHIEDSDESESGEVGEDIDPDTNNAGSREDTEGEQQGRIVTTFTRGSDGFYGIK